MTSAVPVDESSQTSGAFNAATSDSRLTQKKAVDVDDAARSVRASSKKEPRPQLTAGKSVHAAACRKRDRADSPRAHIACISDNKSSDFSKVARTRERLILYKNAPNRGGHSS